MAVTRLCGAQLLRPNLGVSLFALWRGPDGVSGVGRMTHPPDYDRGYDEGFENGARSRNAEVEKLQQRIIELETRPAPAWKTRFEQEKEAFAAEHAEVEKLREDNEAELAHHEDELRRAFQAGVRHADHELGDPGPIETVRLTKRTEPRRRESAVPTHSHVLDPNPGNTSTSEPTGDA
jgi:hypothetical protein